MKSVKKVLLSAILSSGSALLALCPVGLPVMNKTTQTIYVNIARTPAPAETSAQQAVNSGYKKIAPGDSVCFQAGRAPSHFIWVHSLDQNNNLGNPALFDTGHPILDQELYLSKVIVAKTQTPSETKPTNKLILIGKHKQQEVKTAYSLTRSHMRTDASGKKELIPGTVRREASQRDGVEHLLNSLGVYE